jgi:hypothetical protein
VSPPASTARRADSTAPSTSPRSQSRYEARTYAGRFGEIHHPLRGVRRFLGAPELEQRVGEDPVRGGVVRRAGDERLGELARLLEPVPLEQHQPEQPVSPLRVARERERGARAVLRGAVEARIGLLPRLADPRLAEGQPRLRRAGLSPEAPLQVADAAVDGGGISGLPHRQRVTDGEGLLGLLPPPAPPARGGEQDEDSDDDGIRRVHDDLANSDLRPQTSGLSKRIAIV